MTVFLLIPDLSLSGPIWLNVLWPQVRVVTECYDTVILPVPAQQPHRKGGPGASLSEARQMMRSRRELVRIVRDRIDRTGPNILLVWANNAKMMRWAGVLESVWKQFDATVLIVNDAVQHWHPKKHWVTRFDRVLFSCADLAHDYRTQLGVETRHFPAHTDVLAFHSVAGFRPIDMVLVGRRDPSLHDPLFRHYNEPASGRLFLDFATRNQMPMSHEEEFRLLMATYGRSKVAFCYETGTMPRYFGKSPLLARWVHAWAAGCTVVGTRPRGRFTETLMDWEDATMELPQDPAQSIDLMEAVLSDTAGLERRRRRNVVEALRRHDTRLRLRDLVADLGLPRSDRLEAGLAALSARADTLAAGD